MKKSLKIENGIVEYNDSKEIKNLVFDKLMEYFNKYEVYSGETIMQCDELHMEVPEVLSDIADNIIKFNVKFND